jgi:hypothetical protein
MVYIASFLSLGAGGMAPGTAIGIPKARSMAVVGRYHAVDSDDEESEGVANANVFRVVFIGSCSRN